MTYRHEGLESTPAAHATRGQSRRGQRPPMEAAQDTDDVMKSRGVEIRCWLKG